ncbi:5prime-3prime exonuclease [Diplonema papillatum]|nr:5prime-3prime exonuclease [Diplonema papillatum]
MNIRINVAVVGSASLSPATTKVLRTRVLKLKQGDTGVRRPSPPDPSQGNAAAAKLLRRRCNPRLTHASVARMYAARGIALATAVSRAGDPEKSHEAPAATAINLIKATLPPAQPLLPLARPHAPAAASDGLRRDGIVKTAHGPDPGGRTWRKSGSACLVDASIYFFKAYHSLPTGVWSTAAGQDTNGVYGFAAFLLRLLEAERPRVFVACFDASLRTGFRRMLYEKYKETRMGGDEEVVFNIREQMKGCAEFAGLLGLACLSSHVYEADDLIASAARQLRAHGAPFAVLTRDNKDLGQVVRRGGDFLWDYPAGPRLHPAELRAKFGVRPSQLPEYLALVGDPIDCIPGVPGVGPITARALLNAHGDIAGVYRNLGASSKRVQRSLSEHAQQVCVAKTLARTVCDIPLGLSPDDLCWDAGAVDVEGLREFCTRMGFPRLHKRIETVLERVQQD